MKKRTFTKEEKLQILKEASEQGVTITIEKQVNKYDSYDCLDEIF